MSPDPILDEELARIRRVAWRMDAICYIPSTNYSLGLDNILGFIPVVGDALSIAPSIWMIHRARQLGATPGAIAFMIANLVMDLFVGMVPLLGDLFDIAYNANIRNYRLLEKNLARRAERAREVRPRTPPEGTIPRRLRLSPRTDIRRTEMDIIRIICAVILPPLGVFLQEGLGKHFWINILLTLLGYIPGIVHAVYIIARDDTVRT